MLRATRNLITPQDAQQRATTKHGFRLDLNLANPEQARIYFYGDHDERYETALLREIIQPGWTCWDIGANIGFYTCLLAMLTGPGGRVVAFEPATGTRRRLAGNIVLNGFTNVQLRSEAVGAADGKAYLFFTDPELAEGTASMYGSGATQGESIEVDCLDTLGLELGYPDFIKIDVEGAQLDVWRGAERFFRSASPLVMAELRDSPDPAVLETLEQIVRGAGFDIFSIRKGARVSLLSRAAESRGRNYILAKRDSPAHRALRGLVI